MTIECFNEQSEKSYYRILKIVPEAEGNSRYESKLSFVTLSSFIKLFSPFAYIAIDFFTMALYC